ARRPRSAGSQGRTSLRGAPRPGGGRPAGGCVPCARGRGAAATARTARIDAGTGPRGGWRRHRWRRAGPEARRGRNRPHRSSPERRVRPMAQGSRETGVPRFSTESCREEVDPCAASRRDRPMEPTPIYPRREVRRHPRVPASFTFLLQHPSGRHRLVAKNLSMTGLLARDDRRVPEGPVRLEIPAPNDPEPVVIEATATRREDGLVFRFLDLDWRTILVLARYISPHL